MRKAYMFLSGMAMAVLLMPVKAWAATRMFHNVCLQLSNHDLLSVDGPRRIQAFNNVGIGNDFDCFQFTGTNCANNPQVIEANLSGQMLAGYICVNDGIRNVAFDGGDDRIIGQEVLHGHIVDLYEDNNEDYEGQGRHCVCLVPTVGAVLTNTYASTLDCNGQRDGDNIITPHRCHDLCAGAINRFGSHPDAVSSITPTRVVSFVDLDIDNLTRSNSADATGLREQPQHMPAANPGVCPGPGSGSHSISHVLFLWRTVEVPVLGPIGEQDLNSEFFDSNSQTFFRINCDG